MRQSGIRRHPALHIAFDADNQRRVHMVQRFVGLACGQIDRGKMGVKPTSDGAVGAADVTVQRCFEDGDRQGGIPGLHRRQCGKSGRKGPPGYGVFSCSGRNGLFLSARKGKVVECLSGAALKILIQADIRHRVGQKRRITPHPVRGPGLLALAGKAKTSLSFLKRLHIRIVK